MGQLIPIVDITGNTVVHVKATEQKPAPLRSFDGDIFGEIIEESPAYQPEEDFTFTFRISLDLESEEGQAERERLCSQLREKFPEEAEAFIALLDEHEWDVSFLGDFF